MLSSPTGLDALSPLPHGRTALRLTWPHLPAGLRAVIEGRLGSRVVDARSCDSGFTPGLASVVTTESGDRAFLKAASLAAQRPFAEAYLAEAQVRRALGDDVPAPRLLWVEHQRSPGGWVVLGFEAVEGRPPRRPWREPELRRALDLSARIQATAGPRLADLGPADLAEDLPELVDGWQHVDSSWPHHAEVSALARRLPELGNEGFVHADLRDDNILLGSDGHDTACDWNWCCAGPSYFDAVGLLLTAYGDGVDVEPWVRSHPVFEGVAAEELDIALAGLTGFMNAARQRPVPPTSPNLRLHAAHWAEAGWAWLARRRGWR